MQNMQEMKFLIDKIRTNVTLDETVDSCVRLVVKYGDLVIIKPKYDKSELYGFEVREYSEKYRIEDKIFDIDFSWIYYYSSWRYKCFYLSVPEDCNTWSISQKDAIDEKMGKPGSIHRITPGVRFYEAFNKMDKLFCLCHDKVKGLNIDEHIELDQIKTSRDNLVIELGYPRITPEYKADVCTRLLKDCMGCPVACALFDSCKSKSI